LTRYCRSACFH